MNTSWRWSDNSSENRLYRVGAQTSENMVLYKCWLSGISYKWKYDNSVFPLLFTDSSYFLILAYFVILVSFYGYLYQFKSFPGGSDGKPSACSAGDLGSTPGLGRSPGEGNGNPLQYSCLENPMDRGAWRATVHGVAKSQTQLSNFTFTSLGNPHLLKVTE